MIGKHYSRLLFPVCLLITLSLAQSCAFFVNTFDQNRLAHDLITYRPGDKKLYCEKSQDQFQLVNSNKEIQESFRKFLLLARRETPLKYVDKAALWALIQMNLRPDLASPTSKLQALIKTGKNFDYLHYYSKRDGAFPYLMGLEDILKRYNSRHSLLALANLADKLFPDVYTVGPNFEAFLEENKEKIARNPFFKRTYMRADETLKENEKIQRAKIAPLVKVYLKNKKSSSYETSQSLFTYKGQVNAITANCNYDMRLYSNSIYLIHKDFIKSHLFGYKSEEGSFLASASQRLDSLEPVGQSIFFKGASQTRSPAFCAFDFPGSQNKDLWMVSSESRDPGQHIYHLMEYGLDEARGLKGISELIGFSRHLFLEDPTRLVFESNRSSEDQLERLLKLNLPVYNARKLGNIWAMHDGGADSGFVIDDRTDGEITCSK